MPRGWTWAVYFDDRGEPWAVPVDRDALEQPERGWSQVATGELAPFPRGWRMRYALGTDTSGREHRATIATPTADLWTGAARSWIAETSSVGLTEVALLRTIGELSRFPSWKPEPV